MRAITISQPGGPEVLSFAEVPSPTPKTGEVLIDVTATALNRADLLQRQGHYPPPPGASEYLGLECSGRIAELGAGVSEWRVGNEVCALLTGGGYAEQVIAPTGQVLPVPAGVSLAEAAALPEAACTVWSTVFSAAQLMPGETILIHGGAGGIGTMALQLARAYGARVICTASEQNVAACRAHGAEEVVNYHTEDFVKSVREFTEGRGANVILDLIGAQYLARNLEALSLDGRLVVIGMQGGRRGELDLNQMLQKRAHIMGSTLRAREAADKALIVSDVQEHVWPWISAGRIRPVIDRAFALADAGEAHEYFEENSRVGKVLLLP